MRRVELAFLAFVAGLGLSACDSASTSGQDDPDGGSDTDSQTETDTDTEYPIGDITSEWFPCSLFPGENDDLAECSNTPMPLHWGDVDGRTIDIYAKRRLALEQPSEGQMWFLHGGPGASGVWGLPKLLDKVQQQYPQLDVYTIDHRGVGLSDLMDCPFDPYDDAYLSLCINYLEENYGDDLSAYSTSDSAIDVAAYIESVREPGQKVLMWGGSYGSYIAHRYLAIFPEQADGVFVEGIAPADSSFIFTDEGFDMAGKALFEKCAGDAFCSGKMGDDPLSVVSTLFTKIYTQNHCMDKIDYWAYYASYILTRLLYYHPYHNAIPAFAYRLNRCADEDVEPIMFAIDMLFADGGLFGGSDDDGSSTVLYQNVVYSEMWEHPDFPDDATLMSYMTQVENDAVFYAGSGVGMYQEWKVWPKYDDALWDDVWAVTDTSLLMLQGMLDPATRYDRAISMGEHLDGPNQTFVAFPTTPHNVTSGTPVSTDPEVPHCGFQMFIDFLKDPLAPVDQSCVEQVLPNNFEGDVEFAQKMFGTDDLWENPVAKDGATADKVDVVVEYDEEWIENMRSLRKMIRAELPAVTRQIQKKLADRDLSR